VTPLVVGKPTKGNGVRSGLASLLESTTGLRDLRRWLLGVGVKLPLRCTDGGSDLSDWLCWRCLGVDGVDDAPNSRLGMPGPSCPACLGGGGYVYDTSLYGPINRGLGTTDVRRGSLTSVSSWFCSKIREYSVDFFGICKRFPYCLEFVHINGLVRNVGSSGCKYVWDSEIWGHSSWRHHDGVENLSKLKQKPMKETNCFPEKRAPPFQYESWATNKRIRSGMNAIQ